MRQIVRDIGEGVSCVMGRAEPQMLSIVIPALNEAQRLPRTISRLREYLSARPYEWEIIVVSNGSTDATERVVREAAKSMPSLHLLTLKQRGKGLAVRVGALAAAGDVVFTCDADLAMPPEALETFLGAIERADVIVGSREASGARRFGEPGYRHFMGRVFNYLVKALAVRGIDDTQCGFKALRREAARHLFGQQTINGLGFDVELIYLARKFGYAVEELGIDWYHDADSRVRPGVDTVTMVSEVFMIRLRDLLGRYHAAPSPAPTAGDLGR